MTTSQDALCVMAVGQNEDWGLGLRWTVASQSQTLTTQPCPQRRSPVPGMWGRLASSPFPQTAQLSGSHDSDTVVYTVSCDRFTEAHVLFSLPFPVYFPLFIVLIILVAQAICLI